MNDDSIMQALAARNPVREIPPYDELGEARLRALLSQHKPGARVRFPIWTVAAVGVSLAVALAAGVVVTNHTPTQPTPPPRQRVASPPAARFPSADASTPVGLVVDRSTIALHSASNYILQNTETLRTPGHTDVWVNWEDQGDRMNTRHQDFDSAGNLLHDNVAIKANGSITGTDVDYQAHQYSEQVFPVPRKVPMTQSQAIAGALKVGDDKVLGTSVIDGRTVLHLSNVEPEMNRELWVDPNNYLPVRMTAHGSWGSYVINYVWIPRTDANLRSIFAPPVPAGFTKVPPPSAH